MQYSKVLQSREKWKEKATKRGELNRRYRKDIKRSRNTIIELKETIGLLEQSSKKSLTPFPSTNLTNASNSQNIRSLCILMILQAVVSYRSVPRILKLFNTVSQIRFSWIPHFTSVINWSLRFGLGKLQQVKPIDQPWIAIVDHSIDIGTKKAFVVLRVLIDTLKKKGKAIQLSDCECVYVSISEAVNGNSVALEFEEIFQKAGQPTAILKDCDSTLQKGTRLYCAKHKIQIPIIEDIGHVVGSSLKAEFEENEEFKSFKDLINKGANKMRQTKIAYLKPPQLRTKGRFMSISKIGKWADKILAVMSVKGRAKKGSVLEKLRIALPGFVSQKAFIIHFSKTTKIVADIMELLKNNGLDKKTYETCIELVTFLPPNTKVQKRLQIWLEHHYSIQNQLTSFPLLVSSDIIESLFGKFKHVMERSSQADMNRTVLLIPALCGKHTNEEVERTFNMTQHRDIKEWEEKNISYTLRKQKQLFFKPISIQKAG